ncbi:SRPBCC domain-containing protein [Dyadobacter sp. CY347]|uniref:SRPBCC family protein n=1 Tax=Dyadobacter sp. CY347 TaxID=2909336 RepID=UPI001F19241E|nr:SRPBCC domain-containing protein [Dyadobacter sp. CY347]MCF2489436.1 SRPBCC domain-containing protein [Dyadobacter sp. CY347]
MNTNLLLNFTVDKETKKIRVEREFAASVVKVWAAWTQKELLEQWWAPKPWKARTKEMDFREGGHWLYAMVGPEGEEHWARTEYKSITTQKSYSALDHFCDENGTPSDFLPGSQWLLSFNENNSNTIVDVLITFNELSDLEKHLEMGFKEGFLMAFENLDEVLESQQ